jgi:hypothetical protein
MATFAVQYLECPCPDTTPNAARRRLHQACQRLPISLVLLGWELPPALEEAVAEETARQGALLYRWQPWLTSDSHTDLPPEWVMVGPDGTPLPGQADNPTFTFVCPNHSGVADFLTERLEGIAASGLFHGVFLDRIRFPSPVENPAVRLGCFCRYCTRLATDMGLELEPVRRYLQSAFSDKDSARQLVLGLLGKFDSPGNPLKAFLDFRAHSITRTVTAARRQADLLGLSLSLDCFSPILTRMVGQDLQSLDRVCDWIKLMIYPRVFAPAGFPFELLSLATWLVHAGWMESETKDILAEATGLPFPENLTALRQSGFGAGTIAHEIERGRFLGVTHLLAGIALVELKAIHESTPEQVQADIKAARAADGLVISWDLWHTPLEHLDTIRSSWEL